MTEIDAVVTCVKNFSDDSPSDPKEDFLCWQVQILNMQRNGVIYDHNDLCSAFSWLVQSRVMYSTLWSTLILPSNKTLGRINSVARCMDDKDFYTRFFSNQEPRSRGYILLVDEIYEKASIVYSG